MKKIEINIKNFFIFISIIIISFFLFNDFLAIPTDVSDESIQFVIFGNYSFDTLPLTLKNVKLPTSLSESIKYNMEAYGRFGLNPLRLYFFTKIFNRNALLWRIFNIIIITIILILVYRILVLLNFSFIYSLICIFFLLLSSYQYFVSIIGGYSILVLLFLLALNVELSNQSRKKVSTKLSIFGSILFLFSILFRELMSIGFLAFIFIILFGDLNKNDGFTRRIKRKWKNLSPYFVVISIYAFSYFFLTFIFEKKEYAYSSLFVLGINVKRIIKLAIFYFGLGIKDNFFVGVFLLFFILLILLIVLFTKKVSFSRRQIFVLFLCLLILVPYIIIFSCLVTSRGPFFLPILSVLILYLTLFDFILKNISKKVKYSLIIFSLIIISWLFLTQLVSTMNALEFIKARNIANLKTIKFINRELPKDGIVGLKGFDIPHSYAFVADIFLSGRRDNIRYFRYQNKDKWKSMKDKSYIKYLVDSFDSADPLKENPDLIVVNNLNEKHHVEKNIKFVRIISEPVHEFFLNKNTKDPHKRKIVYGIAKIIDNHKNDS